MLYGVGILEVPEADELTKNRPYVVAEIEEGLWPRSRRARK